MSDERIDALAETARNRGLKLVRSRVRTPGKRRFGKVGLTDKAGKAVFGMDDKGPTAKPEEVEDYLRNLGAKDWGASLDVAVLPRTKPQKAKRDAANDAEPGVVGVVPKPKREPKPEPPPKRKAPKVREAKASDADDIVALNRLLGADVDARVVRKGIATLGRAQLSPLVATHGRKVIGVCAIHAMTTIHRDRSVGRISHLVVAEDHRGQGIGRMLTEAAEQQLKKLGCGIIEVTSNDRLPKAHAFYRHLGYERTSMRFVKKL